MKTILQIAEEEGAVKLGDQEYFDGKKWKDCVRLVVSEEALERFAARIRAEQKEKDANICDAITYDSSKIETIHHKCATAIRNQP